MYTLVRDSSSVPIYQVQRITLAFSCGARSAFKLIGKGYLRSMLSRRQLQGFVGRIHNELDAPDAALHFEQLRIKPNILLIAGYQEPPTGRKTKIAHDF
jgi:hypothetical protein